MEYAEYWPMAREYGIWNATIASLQFWAEDLDPVTLGKASERVYNHFFGLQPATPYASCWKKPYLDTSFLHLMQLLHNS